MQNDHSIRQLLDGMFETTADKATAVVAVVSATYPAWRDNLHQFAVVCGDIAQPVALLWLLIQLGNWVLRTFFPVKP